MNATINLEKNHFPVLLNELISIISPLYGGTFIDCTLGQGGYSKEILKTKLNKVIALDRDPDVLQIAKKIEILVIQTFLIQVHLNHLHFQTQLIQ